MNRSTLRMDVLLMQTHSVSSVFFSVSKLSANSRFVYCMQHNFLPFTGKRKKTGPNNQASHTGASC